MNDPIKTLSFEQLPKNMQSIPNPPQRIFYRGNIDLLFKKKKIAIVGSRDNTEYGRVVTEKIATALAKKDITICSGLALGIDSIAMSSALRAEGKVIGAIASGLINQNIGPRKNFDLAMEILKRGGLLISEYPPEQRASRYSFPQRNRLISGISMATVIIEAKIKSGSLITGYHSLAQGKEVFAVPGNIFSPQSQGTNFLISQGAIPVISEKEILYFYGLEGIEFKSVST